MPAHGVIAGHDGTRALHLVDAITLRATRGARIRNLIPFDHDIAGLRLNVEAEAGLLAAVIEHFVVAECVPVSTVEEGLVPEINAAFAVPDDGVVSEFVV